MGYSSALFVHIIAKSFKHTHIDTLKPIYDAKGAKGSYISTIQTDILKAREDIAAIHKKTSKYTSTEETITYENMVILRSTRDAGQNLIILKFYFDFTKKFFVTPSEELKKFEEGTIGLKMEKVSSDTLDFEYRKKIRYSNSTSFIWINALV